jgi:predicted nucleotidyltransferase component of viral defense system
MNVQIVHERLAAYDCRTTIELDQALREISQQIVLAGLGRTDFYDRAGLQGGTCLRIFHGLNRFSEDLDFSLRTADAAFELRPYLEQVRDELSAYGYDLEIDDRSRAGQAVRKAFLKDQSIGRLLNLRFLPRHGPAQKLRIKLEVDTLPPAGASYELSVLDYPFPSSVRIFDLPSLFAGKIHALLCRSYLKGRDWYDFIWYTARGVPINHALLSAALDQLGPWSGTHPETDDAWCVRQLIAAVETLDWSQAREDVRRFVKRPELPSLELWSREFFLAQCRKIPARPEREPPG